MKRLIVIAAIVLLLVGGGLGGLYLFMPGLLGLPQAEPPAPLAVAPEPPPVKPALVHLDTIALPVMLDGKPQRQIQFSVTLVTTPAAQARAIEELPHLRNAVISFAFGFFPEYFAAHPKMELPRLKATLLKLAQRTLGDGVEDVLIQSYIEM